MDDSLKQRVVGGLVVLALIVIFIPVLFNSEHIEPLSKVTQIPAIEPRSVPDMTFPDIDTNSVFDQAKPADHIFVPKEDDAINVTQAFEESAQIKGTSRDKDGVPIAWVLQIASFKQKDKAALLEQQLLGEGYTVFTKTSHSQNTQKIRVFVGPKLDKKLLFIARDKIEKKYKLKTLLIRSKP